MARQRVGIGIRINAYAVMTEAVAEVDDARQRAKQPIGHGLLIEKFSGSKLPSIEQPVRITSIGCASAGIRSSTSSRVAGSLRFAFSTWW